MSTFPISSTLGRALVIIAATSLFACTVGSGTGDPPEVLIVPSDAVAWPTPPPLPSLADFQRDMLSFGLVCAAPARFPLELTVLPFDPAQPVGAVGPGRCLVAPGRAAAVRQSVPSRSRRKLRTWERDAAV